MNDLIEDSSARTRPAQELPVVAANQAVTFIARYETVKDILAKYRPTRRPNRSRPISALPTGDAKIWEEIDDTAPSRAQLQTLMERFRLSHKTA